MWYPSPKKAAETKTDKKKVCPEIVSPQKFTPNFYRPFLKSLCGPRIKRECVGNEPLREGLVDLFSVRCYLCVSFFMSRFSLSIARKGGNAAVVCLQTNLVCFAVDRWSESGFYLIRVANPQRKKKPLLHREFYFLWVDLEKWGVTKRVFSSKYYEILLLRFGSAARTFFYEMLVAPPHFKRKWLKGLRPLCSCMWSLKREELCGVICDRDT